MVYGIVKGQVRDLKTMKATKVITRGDDNNVDNMRALQEIEAKTSKAKASTVNKTSTLTMRTAKTLPENKLSTGVILTANRLSTAKSSAETLTANKLSTAQVPTAKTLRAIKLSTAKTSTTAKTPPAETTPSKTPEICNHRHAAPLQND